MISHSQFLDVFNCCKSLQVFEGRLKMFRVRGASCSGGARLQRERERETESELEQASFVFIHHSQDEAIATSTLLLQA